MFIAADADNAAWENIVSNRSFSLETVKKYSASELVKMSIRQRIKESSLPEKIDLLRNKAGQHCAISEPALEFKYDQTRLKELDRLRHDVVHDKWIRVPNSPGDSQEFFYGLTIYAGLVTASMLWLGISYPQIISEWVLNGLGTTSAPPP